MRYMVTVARSARVYYQYEVAAHSEHEVEQYIDDYETYGRHSAVRELGSTLQDDDDDGYEIIDIHEEDE